MPAEGTEFDQRLDERVLDNIFRLFTLSDHMHDAGKESILIAAHKLAEGGGIACQGLVDQLSFVGHVVPQFVANRMVRQEMEARGSPSEGPHADFFRCRTQSWGLGQWLIPAAVILPSNARVVKRLRVSVGVVFRGSVM